MDKVVIVINGQGGSGKDTVCKITAKRYKVMNISTVDPIKDIATYAGWQGEKTDAARKMLADLKQTFIAYNDLPLNYVLKKQKEFLENDDEIMFVHCRESEEIKKIVDNALLKTVTLLIRRNDPSFKHKNKAYGNHADDDVEQYDYDFIYDGNNETIEQLEEDFNKFFDGVMLPVLNKQLK